MNNPESNKKLIKVTILEFKKVYVYTIYFFLILLASFHFLLFILNALLECIYLFLQVIYTYNTFYFNTIIQYKDIRKPFEIQLKFVRKSVKRILKPSVLPKIPSSPEGTDLLSPFLSFPFTHAR